MIFRLICMIVFASSFAFARQGVPSKVVLVVKDDEGKPVSNATVSGCFLDLSQSGFGDEFKGQTDTNGIYVVSGNAVLGIFARISSPDFYPTRLKQNVKYKASKEGRGYERLERWDKDIPVLLKRIRNPIELHACEVENPYVDLWEGVGKYNMGKTSSYDIVKGAFLPPYGNGEVADLDFTWKMTIYSKDGDGIAWDYDTLCEVRLTNVVDGICKGQPDGSENRQLGSRYICRYQVPADGYTNMISFYRNVRGTKADTNDDRHYLYYFRIRTQTNDVGQITNSLYGKIYGQINGRFTYYLNPTPNDRNVEEKRKFHEQ